MANKKTMVDLIVDNKGVENRAFEIKHAAKILTMPNNGGWKLPPNSPYELNDNNELVKRGNTKSTKEPKE